MEPGAVAHTLTPPGPEKGRTNPLMFHDCFLFPKALFLSRCCSGSVLSSHVHLNKMWFKSPVFFPWDGTVRTFGIPGSVWLLPQSYRLPSTEAFLFYFLLNGRVIS